MKSPTNIGKGEPRALVWMAGVCLAIALICAAAYYADPYGGSRWLPQCWWHAFTGWQCPSCGSTRALHHLMHGQWQLALLSNPFLWCTVAMGIVAFCLWLRHGLQGRWVEKMGWLYAALAIAWGIVRNIWDL